MLRDDFYRQQRLRLWRSDHRQSVRQFASWTDSRGGAACFSRLR